MELLHGKDAPSGHHRVLTTDEDESPRAEAVAFPHSPMMDHGTPETSPTSARTSGDCARRSANAICRRLCPRLFWA